jgi:hypothetical protein
MLREKERERERERKRKGKRERERERKREGKRERERERERERGRERESAKEREREREVERKNFIKGMMGALAPFTYLYMRFLDTAISYMIFKTDILRFEIACLLFQYCPCLEPNSWKPGKKIILFKKKLFFRNFFRRNFHRNGGSLA